MMPILRTAVAEVARALTPKPGTAAGGWNAWPWNWPGERTLTGRIVDHDVAMTVTAVYRAVAIIANLAGALPLHVYSKNTEGHREKIEDERERYLWARPNPEVPRATFWITVFAHLALTGNAYLYVVTAAPTAPRPARQPIEIWPVEPKRVRIGRDGEGRKVYEIDGTTPERDFVAGGNIVHIQGFGTDGLRGLSPIEKARQAIALAMASEEWAARWYGSGSEPGGYLSSEQDLTAAQAQQYSEAWEETHRSLDNAHRMAVLGKGTKWMSTTLNPEDMQMIAARQFQVAEVSRIFGVPEHLLGSHDKQSSWGTGIEVQNRGLLTYTIDPLIVVVEQTISDELLGPANHYAKFNREGLLRGTAKEQAEYLQILRQNLIINGDEWRALMDMEPIPGGVGQEYFNPNTKTDKPATAGSDGQATGAAA